MRYKKKAVVVDAWRWLFNGRQDDAPSWVTDALGLWPRVGGIAFEPDHSDGPRIAIATLDAVALALPGDWIIRGVEGELYPCKHHIFAQIHEMDGPPGAVIRIAQSKTADTRSCDFASVSKETLLASSRQHIGDVGKGLAFFAGMIAEAADRHDYDKLSDIDSFHADFVTGFAQTGWWDRHRVLNRHHLLVADGVPEDVNLIDVLDMIADCVMAGMARTGTVYPLDVSPDVLMRAFQNTVAALQANVVVEPSL